LFGYIQDGKMMSNKNGKIAEEEWIRTKDLRKNVDLDYYVIMPNHFHGIIIINDVVGTRDRVSLRSFGNIGKDSLSLIINQYKGSVTRFAHKNDFANFHWQPGFYEHIIRNDNDLHRIITYIRNNPLHPVR
jgi:REP element-mobilizing transposase RayT